MFPRLRNAVYKMLHPVEAAGAEKLGDFTMTVRTLWIAGLAIFIGLVSAFVALALLRLIGFFTNLFFFGRVSGALVSPAGNHLARQ